MYMDLSSWDIENRRSFEQTAMTMSSIPSSGNSLPPLHQAIPEFHSHTPRERRSSSVPRKVVDRGSPFRPHRVSPISSSAMSDAGGMATFSFFDSDYFGTRKPELKNYPGIFLTGCVKVATPGEPTEGSYDAQTYPFPGQLDSRRINSISSNSSPHIANPRPSPYLPPVSSLTSSRGSSFDMEPSERPPVSLPSLYNSHHPQPHSTYAQYEQHDAIRSQQTTPDYHRYSAGSALSASPSYQSSPVSQYSQPQYYAHSGQYSQPTRPGSGYDSRPVGTDGRSPFSIPGHVDPNADHFEGRPGKRRRGNLPKQVTDLLRSWLNEHISHPYPTEDEKQMLMAQTGLTIHQISNWFINARRRRLPAITNSDSKSSSSRRPSSGQ